MPANGRWDLIRRLKGQILHDVPCQISESFKTDVCKLHVETGMQLNLLKVAVRHVNSSVS
jgi:hypothetical protein